MKVSTKNITEIKRRLLFLQTNFHIDVSDEEIRVGDEDIFVQFPEDEYMDQPYSIEDFLKYTDYIENLQQTDDSTVTCGKIRQTIIDVDRYKFDYLVPNLVFQSEYISMQIIEDPFLIGLIASKEGLYNEDFGVYPCSSYMAVELEYKTERKLSKMDEDTLIKSFLYHIASQSGVSIKVGKLIDWEDLTGEEKQQEGKPLTTSDLIPYTDAMEYYVNALSIENNEIKYLYFYKIIEFFSPLVSKKRSYELLNLKLDALSIKNRDHTYLESIFKLTREYEVSLKDRELAYTALNECIDIIEIFEYLPDPIKVRLSKKINFKKEEYSRLTVDKISELKKELGIILYDTRNNIVHAKSNYRQTGNECSIEDMEDMNEFISKLCHCLIVWNGRQPKEFQML